MKTLLLLAVALVGWASTVYASEAYSDPGEYRAPGVAYSTSETTFVPPDTTMTRGQTASASAMSFSAPDTSMAPGMTYGASAQATAGR